LGVAQKGVTVAHPAKRIGANRPNIVRWDISQALAEAFQRDEGSPAYFFTQAFTVVESGGQAHGIAHAIDDGELTVGHPRHFHVKTVGAEIYCGDSLGRSHRVSKRIVDYRTAI
jgi:hypothetical protein